jgi:hypothetical protein
MAVAVDPCVYNKDIKAKELNHPGFLYPVNPLKEITFTHNHKSFLVVNGQIFDHHSNPRDAAAVTTSEFVPSRYYRGNQRTQDAFYAAMHKELVKPENRVNLLDSVSCLSRHIDADICKIFGGAIVEMFCSPLDLVSRLRFILLCAFGMLYNFVNQSKFKLLLRGGMALRMNLIQFNGDHRNPDIMRTMVQISQMIQDSPRIDMDAVVIVDPSVSADEMAAFKTVFIKVLLHSIRKLTAARNYNIVCAAASGDAANTTKVKIQKIGDDHSSELADISFKYADDPVIMGYGDYSQQMEFSCRTRMVPEISDLTFTWIYPSIDQLEREYAYVVDRLETQLKDIGHDPELLKRNKYDTDRFMSKRSMVRGVTAARAAQEAQAAQEAAAYAAYMEAQAAASAAVSAAAPRSIRRQTSSNRRHGSSHNPSSGGKKRRGHRKRTVRRKRH